MVERKYVDVGPEWTCIDRTEEEDRKYKAWWPNKTRTQYPDDNHRNRDMPVIREYTSGLIQIEKGTHRASLPTPAVVLAGPFTSIEAARVYYRMFY